MVACKGHKWYRVLGQLLFTYQITVYSSIGETPFYERDAKFSTALNFYSPWPKTVMIYLEYSTILFKEVENFP